MDILLLGGTATLNTDFMSKAGREWNDLNKNNPSLANDLGTEQYHNLNRLFQNRSLLREYWEKVYRKATGIKREVADWIGNLYFNRKVDLRLADETPNRVDVYYQHDNQSHKIASGNTADGQVETFDNGIMNGDFEASDIRERSNGSDGIVCVTRGGRSGQKNCGIVGGACFVAGTLVKTPNGDKDIETIEAGDEVIAYDTKKGESVTAKVKQAFTRGVAQIYRVIIGKDTINTTAEHPFYTNNGWQPANTLKKGIKVLTLASALLAIDTVYAFDSLATVYNFEVEERHNYFVGREGVLVHNSYFTWLRANEMRESISSWAINYQSNLPTPTQKGKFNTACVVYVPRTGDYYFGRNGGITNTAASFPSISASRGLDIDDELRARLPDETGWPHEANCAECDAVNQALHNNHSWDEIQMHTIGITPDGKIFDKAKCDECQDIFWDVFTTSE